MSDNKIRLQNLAPEPWAPAFSREFELVLAENEFEAMLKHSTLYNDILNLRISDFCRPLDQGLTEDYLGVIHIPPNAEGWKRVPEATAFLKARGRGTWAIFEMDGKYDAYMANGAGGVATRSGNKFTSSSVIDDEFDLRHLYAHVWSWESYHSSQRVRAEIIQATAERNMPDVGTVATDRRLDNKTFRKIEFLGTETSPEGTVSYLVKASRPGVRAAQYRLGAPSLVSVFGLTLVMPDHYASGVTGERIRSMTEMREEAAGQAWKDLVAAEAPDVSPRGTIASFRQDGDTLGRPVFTDAGNGPVASGTFTVRFAPGSATVLDSELALDGIPAPGMR